jgi:hypothetical protein
MKIKIIVIERRRRPDHRKRKLKWLVLDTGIIIECPNRHREVQMMISPDYVV